ncbi:MAG: hypothetical protein IPP69_11485 [Flavobacteriales bacterium]|nr:hypothetical protein [Flavobacteriales bacterium]
MEKRILLFLSKRKSIIWLSVALAVGSLIGSIVKTAKLIYETYVGLIEFWWLIPVFFFVVAFATLYVLFERDMAVIQVDYLAVKEHASELLKSARLMRRKKNLSGIRLLLSRLKQEF